MESLQGKVALLTCAGKGIGRAVALALAAEGVQVGLLARTESDLQEVAAEIVAACGDVATAVADVADRTAVNVAVAGGGNGVLVAVGGRGVFVGVALALAGMVKVICRPSCTMLATLQAYCVER